MGARAASPSTSVLLAGGGLANSLIAYRLAKARPEATVTLVEGGATLGGRHTWSYFASDLPPRADWVSPFVVRRWEEYEVRFPRRQRRIGDGYRSVTSERLHEVVLDALGGHVRLNAPIASVESNTVRLKDGTALEADLVIDGRGPSAMPELFLGYQKFVGLTVSLWEDHGLAGPILMDATVVQRDGYRFLYVLPWDARTLLIEDTFYSDRADLDHGVIREAIGAYASAQGWRVKEVLAEEEGVLPVALEGDIQAYWRRLEGVARSGLRAALFHPTTGYSLPDAVNLADALSAEPILTSPIVEALVRSRSLSLWKERAFFRLLNRMLFRAAAPEERYRVFERFYGLSEPLIRRFYAAQLTRADKLRLITGKPPVPFGAALHCISERGPA
jgi:lycopene beta-cyclase